MQKYLAQVNNLLIQYFGIPYKNENKVSPLSVLIGTVLSQNTNDKNSFIAYQNLRAKIKDWSELTTISEEELNQLIKPAGLTRQKSAAIQNIIQLVYVQKKLPINSKRFYSKTDEEILKLLTELPGVGVKTAACVLLFALNRNICPVDTHVHRILNRIGIIETNTPEKSFWAIQPFLPEQAHALHTNLIRLGRSFCKPNQYYCTGCPIEKICKFPQKNFTDVVTFVHNDFMLLDSL